MTDVIHFPTSPSIAVRKADADQIDLLDTCVEGHELLNQVSAIVADDIVKSTPARREILGRLADWMRLFKQDLAALEHEIKDAA